MFQSLRHRGQTSLEYVAMVIVVIAALLTTQNYFKRSVQGRMKGSADTVGTQYDPMFAETSLTHRVKGNTVTYLETQSVAEGIQTLRTDNSIMIETKDGQTTVVAE